MNETKHLYLSRNSINLEELKTNFENLTEKEKNRYKLVERHVNGDEEIGFVASDPYLLFFNDFLKASELQDTKEIRKSARQAWADLPSNEKASYQREANTYSYFPRELDLSLIQENFYVENPNFKENYE